MPFDTSPPSTGPRSSALHTDSEATSGEGSARQSKSRLNRVIEDISASLQDLRAAVKEADVQAEPGAAPGESPPGPEAGGYRDFFELAPEACLVTDAQITIQESNPAAAAMLKVDRASLKGKYLRDYVAPEDRPAFQATLIQLREGGEKRNWELRLQVADGTPVPVSINVGTQTDVHDKLVRMLWLLRDAGECKAGEEQLKFLLTRIRSSFHGIVEAFAEAVEMKDPQTAGHQKRVAKLAVAIAREMGFSLNQLEGMEIAGLLHDIGKMAVPTEILTKPGEISHLESELIKTHCQAGFDLLKDIDFPWPVQQAILQHHERLDGSGYPAGLTDADIILEARILGVADVVEAMNYARTYGPAQGIDKALEEIYHKMGILYDPEIVDICLKLFVEKRFTFI